MSHAAVCAPLSVRPASWWLAATVVTEDGSPRAVRLRPGVDSPASRAALPNLGTINHELADVGDDGQPRPAYDAALTEFDAALRDAIEAAGDGVVVAVDTADGRRTHYVYAASADDFLRRVADVCDAFPYHRLSVDCRRDPDWQVYDRLRTDVCR